ncbi:alanyl-tRNA editing protein Aarsd1-B-like [Saccoglossus kowalevskii]|uniref:Alanyl-tRNA editing protein Aarsd1-B-like n=1 Tax=Saccoglossus kowalevskii TaxID=10224 RepID=A0ABM0M769_SACKO|nr:PREDICTED: alanyl-tRNA editing protein Aarsd1-B-like [Saccoglossus kowalevskii]
MVFECQRDSFKTEFTTTVVSSIPAQLDTGEKKQTISGYEVILKDTILFPEGGGQIDGIPVTRVTRKGADAIHFVQEPIEPGKDVKLVVDWTRRFDNMQQHSGQHLITAIADNMFGFKTTSWMFSKDVCLIELDTPKVTSEQIEAIEKACNDAILKCVPVTPKYYQPEDDELANIRSRGLPDDHVGLVRVITIEGIDVNMCCGTHVSNLSQLQCIKLLGVEKSKKRTNLLYLTGNRVLKYLGKCYNTEKALCTALKCSPEEHVDMANKLQKSVREVQKSKTMLLREVAKYEAEKLKSSTDNVMSLHRKDGDNEYMNIIANEIGQENGVVFVSVGNEKGAGLFLISGPEVVITEAGPKVAEILDGKGAGKNGKYQGKVNNLKKKKVAIDFVKTLLCKTNSTETTES